MTVAALWLLSKLLKSNMGCLTYSVLSSDADSEVLADYVLALIRNDGSLAELRSSAIENLDDFLKNRMLLSDAV